MGSSITGKIPCINQTLQVTKEQSFREDARTRRIYSAASRAKDDQNTELQGMIGDTCMNRGDTGCLLMPFLVPRILAHVALVQDSILESANEISVSLGSTSTACASPLIGIGVHISVGWRGIVCRAGLQADRGVGV